MESLALGHFDWHETENLNNRDAIPLERYVIVSIRQDMDAIVEHERLFAPSRVHVSWS